MEKFSRILGQGLLIGSVAWALALPGSAFADSPLADSSTVTTTTTTTTMPSETYTDVTGTTTTTTWAYAYDGHQRDFYRHDLYNQRVYNYYAGYGSMYDLNRGYTLVRGLDGLQDRVSLNDNRTLVRLSADSTLEPRLDVERGFDRGMVDAPMSSFDPFRLEIHTGRTVTFYASEGAHTVQIMDGNAMKETVIITPNQVYSWTFTDPGLYRFEDSFGGGPSGPHIHGLLIRVRGDSVAWDDSMFCDANLESTVTRSAAAITVTPTITETEQQTTETPAIQVQGQQTQAPTKKVQKTILRNQDIK